MENEFKTSQNSHSSFRKIFNTSNFQAIFLWLFTWVWSLVDGGASKDDKMSSTHPNLILSDVLSSMRQREHIRRKPILRFQVWPIVTLQLPVWLSTKIYKSYYLGFCSSDFKAEDRFGNLLIKRIHGEKLILIFLVLYL